MGRFRNTGFWVAPLGCALACAACSLGYDADELSGGGAPASAGTAGASGASGTGGAGGKGQGGKGSGGSAGSSGGAGASGAPSAGSAGKGGAGSGGVGGNAAGTSGSSQGGAAGSSGASAGSGGSTAGPSSIYWLEHGSDTVNRANADGSGAEELHEIDSLSSYVRSIALDAPGDKLYFSDDSRQRVEWANLDGSDAATLLSDLDKPVGIATDLVARKLYVVDQGTPPAVFRANLDGTEFETLITAGLDNPYGIALDVANDRLFLVDNGNDQVLRAELDGSNLADLGIAGVNVPIQISLDVAENKLYWSELGPPARIRRANLDGSNPEDIVTEPDVGEPLGLVVDTVGRRLYFVDGDGTIARSELDGSNVVPLLEDLDDPVGIALRY
jgi:hypothetical protein